MVIRVMITYNLMWLPVFQRNKLSVSSGYGSCAFIWSTGNQLQDCTF